MVRVNRVLLGFAGLAVIASAAAAQEPLSLQIRDGQVTIKAQNTPLRTILAEWARVGGTNVIGADRVTGAPVTVELTAVPEQEALEVLLRNVSGYMLAFRPAGSQGASLYNRILIMPPSVAPRVLPQQATGVAPRLPQGNVPGTDDAPPDIVLEGPPANRPGPALRQPTIAGPNGPVPAPLPIPETSAPVSPATTPGVVVTPGNPFGVPPGSSSQPGVVTPVPQQQPPGQRQDPN